MWTPSERSAETDEGEFDLELDDALGTGLDRLMDDGANATMQRVQTKRAIKASLAPREPVDKVFQVDMRYCSICHVSDSQITR